ncbi:MAG: DUF131 domain-containing protein [Candidatus Thermoplasmatota archaeon]|nr:DUF131 domain-containing protein [Candidatus Thermoplasmatota archaeon]
MGIKDHIHPITGTAVVLLFLSVMMLVQSCISGDIEVYLFLIFPVFKVSGTLGTLSILLLIAGSLALFISFLGGNFREHHGPLSGSKDGMRDRKDRQNKGNNRWGGVVFLGPIPLVFGDAEIRRSLPSWWVLLILGIVLMFILSILVTISMIAW